MEEAMIFNHYLKLLMIPLIFLLITGCGGGGGGSDDNTNDSGTTVSEPAQLQSASKSVEDAFKSGVPANVLAAMSDEAKTFYTEDIDNIENMMVDFGKDFENRKLIYSSDNYAEYEFTADGETYTVTFSRQDDGTWKLTRF